MARTALVRSASLAPEEAELADRLAELMARGSFTELTRFLLQRVGVPLRRRLEELVEAGVDPRERLTLLHAALPPSDEELRAFYAPSTWPDTGPAAPVDEEAE